MKKNENLDRAIELEREAHQWREKDEIQKAFSCYDQAAQIYTKESEFKMAAFCFASAASCWNIHTGWQDLRNASTRTRMAADAAMHANDVAYAKQLYSEAAVLFEKEGDGEAYSHCFYLAQTAARKLHWLNFVHSKDDYSDKNERALTLLTHRLRSLKRWLFSCLNNLVWGYGERPMRTLISMGAVIFISSIIYYLSHHISASSSLESADFWESCYFSVITFSTVGYGDYTPLGAIRFVSMLESLAGISLMPLFLISLTRRYLRMSK